ncbi:probable WRKY transcription factor 32 isoform X1 [Lactuca sativa]|uniref:probable WRKY transcription factor 32 isoform X1 n=1 Tax=Lactuca sativa TaxID=4236 RepID=UPI000CA9F3AA|nr:probable WRKY transcription factor 32 isoform X1 [Lactuca sativa]
MDDDSDRSSEATQLEENTTAEDTMHHDDDDDDDQSDATPLQYSSMSPEEDSATSQSLTLAVSDLSEVPIKYEMQRDELERLKNQLQGSHQEALATVIAQAARARSRIQISNSQGQIQLNNADVAEAKQNNTIDVPRSLSASHNVKTQIDGYNWRKYGQKQVKSPQGSRSYYKCTYSNCDAKKMESCDEYNSVTKLVYKGQHKHDPPTKIVSNGSKILSTPKRKSISTPGLKLSNSQQNQRVKKSKSSGESHDCVLKNPKKPKFIVHAADDVEISADGYRWRKYGQKMVKGNPHPRNYYKCTCAGCGVTKHIEKAIDGTSNIVITYKGVHDHDKPVPKKRRGHPHPHAHAHAHGVVTFSPSSNMLSTQVSGAESVKRIESTPTLVSVGFEIK